MDISFSGKFAWLPSYHSHLLSWVHRGYRIKWSALINPVTRDAPRIRLHLIIVEALNALLWFQSTDPGGMDDLFGHGRDRTMDRVRARRASYHCATTPEKKAMEGNAAGKGPGARRKASKRSRTPHGTSAITATPQLANQVPGKSPSEPTPIIVGTPINTTVPITASAPITAGTPTSGAAPITAKAPVTANTPESTAPSETVARTQCLSFGEDERKPNVTQLETIDKTKVDETIQSFQVNSDESDRSHV
ncbi:hypothetical protein Y032_0488g2357 [Ancylostoma ceylanicum]|uniref:Uncharacterized protein n=1 Tax=Ancylostoma ceylanicum TaxID=53326 RepID=A0A016WVB4_9BILA|nr:hypothetical protein Y032_0488g2357 [Ancylostoma ceylanicum]